MYNMLSSKNIKDFKQITYDQIIEFIIECSKLMLKTYFRNDRKINNDENLIRNILFEEFLDNDTCRSNLGMDGAQLRFAIENSENYCYQNKEYNGRTDIRILTDHWFLKRDAYYIVECKRIDKTVRLNRAYIKDGIARFISKKPLYPSYYNKSIMYGMVVKNIDIVENIIDINEKHKKYLSEYTTLCFTKKKLSSDNLYATYETQYSVNDKSITIEHIFFDFSSII